jgi:glycosyltransferase involved in cell wall biosynthesis
MRIGLIIYERLDRLTGGYLYDRLLVSRLRNSGHRVDVLSLPGRGYPLGLLDNLRNPLWQALQERRFDLLLEDALCHPSLVFRKRYLQRHPGAPRVGVVHQVRSRQILSGSRRHLIGRLERWYLQALDAFVFTSKTTRANTFGLIGRKGKHLTASPGGDRLGWLTSENELSERNRQTGPLRLLTVANVTANKGLMPLIRCLSRLPRDAWHLTIVGSLEMEPACARSLMHFISQGALEPQVRLRGAIDEEALAGVYRGSHLFVLPFSCEGFGIACLEAMAWGVPVVGSTEGGVREFVRHGDNGFLVAPGDLRACAGHVQMLQRRRDVLMRLSREALRTFHGWPKWDATLEAVERFLEDVASGKQKRAEGGRA